MLKFSSKILKNCFDFISEVKQFVDFKNKLKIQEINESMFLFIKERLLILFYFDRTTLFRDVNLIGILFFNEIWSLIIVFFLPGGNNKLAKNFFQTNYKENQMLKQCLLNAKQARWAKRIDGKENSLELYNTSLFMFHF